MSVWCTPAFSTIFVAKIEIAGSPEILTRSLNISSALVTELLCIEEIVRDFKFCCANKDAL